ncbi:Arginine kinase [Camponotus floridanus]|uniref:arginine kinase n=1 Tax=Camponotus floridanus TaxID=104421 RepID=E2ATE6_CAMFO|nr:Arginine kinase [Camponotus floridanus]
MVASLTSDLHGERAGREVGMKGRAGRGEEADKKMTATATGREKRDGNGRKDSVDIYASDVEGYTVFAEIFDPIIDDYHGGFKKTDKHPPKDFGDVHSFGNLDPTEVQQMLIYDHFLFKEDDRFLQAANACRFCPTGRGIFHNDDKTLVWVNEEDHLRIISLQMSGDLGQFEKRLPFSHNDRFGFLTFCPTNLGTTVRASVHIKVPKLAANKAKLEEVAAKYNLQVRDTRDREWHLRYLQQAPPRSYRVPSCEGDERRHRRAHQARGQPLNPSAL